MLHFSFIIPLEKIGVLTVDTFSIFFVFGSVQLEIFHAKRGV